MSCEFYFHGYATYYWIVFLVFVVIIKIITVFSDKQIFLVACFILVKLDGISVTRN